MDAQLINWGGLAGLLALGVAILRVVVVSARDTSRSLRGQDKELAELKGDVAGLDAKVSGLAEGQAELKGGQVRLEDHIIQLAGGLGEVKGELKRIAPREKVAAGGS